LINLFLGIFLGLMGVPGEVNTVKISIVFNNMAVREDLGYGWGMAAYIEGYEKDILFDTGENGRVLIENMKKLGLNPQNVDVVVLSHEHYDHVGGLMEFLSLNSDVDVFLLKEFSSEIKEKIKKTGARVIETHEGQEIVRDVFVTGALGKSIPEQALYMKTDSGIVIITGCSHPGIVNIVEKVKKLTSGDKIYLLSGGFHLMNSKEKETREIGEKLREIGVKKMAASHCTGEKAVQIFKEMWKDDFIPGGRGAVFEIPR